MQAYIDVVLVERLDFKLFPNQIAVGRLLVMANPSVKVRLRHGFEDMLLMDELTVLLSVAFI